jgi:hypothetical protein
MWGRLLEDADGPCALSIVDMNNRACAPENSGARAGGNDRKSARTCQVARCPPLLLLLRLRLGPLFDRSITSSAIQQTRQGVSGWNGVMGTCHNSSGSPSNVAVRIILGLMWHIVARDKDGHAKKNSV